MGHVSGAVSANSPRSGDDFQSIFGRAFVQAYERETARIKGEVPASGGSVMMNAGELRLESASFSHDGGRDYNEDAVGDSDAFGAVRLSCWQMGPAGRAAAMSRRKPRLPRGPSSCACQPSVRTPASVHIQCRPGRQAEAGQGDAAVAYGIHFVAILVDYRQRQALIGNLGDSRCYAFRSAQVIGQSYDHSLVQRFIDAGLYPAERLREHPKRNVLYASLGANEESVEPFVSETRSHCFPATVSCSAVTASGN